MADIDYEGQLRKAKDRFDNQVSNSESPTTIHKRMRSHDQVLNRSKPLILADEMEAHRDGIEYQSYDAEKAYFDHLSVLKMNPTLFDVVPLSKSISAKNTAREIMYWAGKSWEIEDYGRQWDIGSAGGQIKYGWAAQRKMWKTQEATGDYDEDEVEDGKIKRRRHPFYWQLCDPYGVYWLGDDQSEFGPDIAFYEYELPYIEMQTNYKRKNESGDYEYPTLDSVGALNWVGQDERVGMETTLETCRVVVCDYRDPTRECPIEGCEHPQRVIKTFVCPRDGTISPESYVQEVDSPFPMCSFFIVGGNMQLDERDLNLKFRPLIGPLLGECQMESYLTTELLVMTRMDYMLNRLYLDVSAVQNPSLLPNSEDPNRVTMEFPQPEEGQIAYFPGEIKRIPSDISQHLVTQLQVHREKMQAYLPNRFAVGNAYPETAQATSTAYLAAQQQSALPYNTLLAESDKNILRSILAEIHAIKFWALSDPEGVTTRYYAAMGSDQTHVKYSGKQPKSGDVVWVDAKKLSSIDYDIIIKTKSQTQAEAGAAWLTADNQHDKGALPTDQWIAATGTDDVEGTKQELLADQSRAAIAPDIMQMKRQLLLRTIYARSGYNFGSPQGQPGEQAQPQQPQPLQGPPGAPPGSSQNNGGSVVPPNSIMGRHMQGASIPSPQGGSSPVG